MMPEPRASRTPRPLGRVLLAGWKDFTALSARYQRSALLSSIYLVILGSGALLARIGRDPLIDTRVEGTTWVERKDETVSLSSLKRQY